MPPELLVLSLVVIGAVCYAGYKISERYRRKTFCPSCGGEMTPDAQKYRYTIEWTCNECGDTVEQLRTG